MPLRLCHGKGNRFSAVRLVPSKRGYIFLFKTIHCDTLAVTVSMWSLFENGKKMGLGAREGEL